MSIPLPREQHEEKREEHQGSLNKVLVKQLVVWGSKGWVFPFYSCPPGAGKAFAFD